MEAFLGADIREVKVEFFLDAESLHSNRDGILGWSSFRLSLCNTHLFPGSLFIVIVVLVSIVKNIRKHLTVVGERTVLELRGIACIPLETQAKPKKGIMTAKSFGKPVESEEELLEAISTYTAQAAEKLRKQESVASSISVFLHTNAFKKDAPQYSNRISHLLPFPTSFTPDLLNVAREMIHSIYREGYTYSKCGVFLSKIAPQEVMQSDLFGGYSIEREYKKARLMCVVDLINQWWGNNTLFFGAQGIDRVWKMRQERRSPRYTTRWGEIVVVRS
jgi:DNA polymerase V